ncbi:hypothetical protein GE061_011940 [Apolygus lucorum]|uniref:Uncharacterized protein n=1 Tax=Apolygus lucorum TaxID=248454 RepID=A0A8S9XT70_APOLU|nr:hypothetical protein GE061_011940 [Apolygus lucorum]
MLRILYKKLFVEDVLPNSEQPAFVEPYNPDCCAIHLKFHTTSPGYTIFRIKFSSNNFCFSSGGHFLNMVLGTVVLAILVGSAFVDTIALEQDFNPQMYPQKYQQKYRVNNQVCLDNGTPAYPPCECL